MSQSLALRQSLKFLSIAQVSFITPLDQPTGKRRLLQELRSQLKSSEFSELWLMVASRRVVYEMGIGICYAPGRKNRLHPLSIKATT